MLLSDVDLLGALKDGSLEVTPSYKSMIQPASIEVRLGGTFKVYRPKSSSVVRAWERPDLSDDFVTVDAGGDFDLHPDDFVLATTVETVRLGPGLAARLEGKSSLARMGLLTHVTAGWIDPGFHGEITMELKNLLGTTLQLRPGMKIGQLCVFRMSSHVARPYGWEGLGSHYQHQAGPTTAR